VDNLLIVSPGSEREHAPVADAIRRRRKRADQDLASRMPAHGLRFVMNREFSNPAGDTRTPLHLAHASGDPQVPGQGAEDHPLLAR
jgi:hypothetical protein